MNCIRIVFTNRAGKRGQEIARPYWKSYEGRQLSKRIKKRLGILPVAA